MLGESWPAVSDDSPTFTQHWVNVSRTLMFGGRVFSPRPAVYQRCALWSPNTPATLYIIAYTWGYRTQVHVDHSIALVKKIWSRVLHFSQYCGGQNLEYRIMHSLTRDAQIIYITTDRNSNLRSLKHTTTLFSFSDHYILSREWRVIVDQVETNYHGIGLWF